MNQSPSCFPFAAVILAAGEARRMGKSKQLLPFGSGTLLSHAIETAVAAGCSPVIVVVGADADAVQASIASKRVEIVRNTLWQSGMGSSIAAGVRHLKEMGAESAAIAILLADQPFVTARHLSEMRTLLLSAGAPAVAAEYNGTCGVPAVFRRQASHELSSLHGEGGAKNLLLDPKVSRYPLPEAGIDIDTPADFLALQQGGKLGEGGAPILSKRASSSEPAE